MRELKFYWWEIKNGNGQSADVSSKGRSKMSKRFRERTIRLYGLTAVNYSCVTSLFCVEQKRGSREKKMSLILRPLLLFYFHKIFRLPRAFFGTGI